MSAGDREKWRFGNQLVNLIRADNCTVQFRSETYPDLVLLIWNIHQINQIIADPQFHYTLVNRVPVSMIKFSLTTINKI